MACKELIASVFQNQGVAKDHFTDMNMRVGIDTKSMDSAVKRSPSSVGIGVR